MFKRPSKFSEILNKLFILGSFSIFLILLLLSIYSLNVWGLAGLYESSYRFRQSVLTVAVMLPPSLKQLLLK